MSLLIKNAQLANGDLVDVRITGEHIQEVGKALTASTEEIVDIEGNYLLPGLVDMHTHLREPGREDSETVLSGSKAAVAGGYTAVSAMANTNPVADTAGVVEQILRLGHEAGLCDVFPIGAVTQGQKGLQLAELGAMASSVAKVRIFSDDGHCVDDPLIMRRALEYVKTFDGIIAQHAQDPRLTVGAQMNEGVVSSLLGLTGWPAIAEEAISARDILLAEHVGSRLHICHLTTAGGVELVRWAKSRGVQVTAEVTPHHLLLTDESVYGYDPIYKVNPPLRTTADVLALRRGLADGTIDVVATDHAPHPTEDKECEWQAAAFGMIGLETSLAIVVKTMIETGLMSWVDLVDRMSTAPAKISGYSDHGQEIAKGSKANLVVVNPNQAWEVNREMMSSKSKNTPFHGMSFSAKVKYTIFNGKIVMNIGTVAGVKDA